jgi:hypothetical protein
MEGSYLVIDKNVVEFFGLAPAGRCGLKRPPKKMILPALGAAFVCVIIYLYWVWRLAHPGRVMFEKRTPSIMGTETTLKAMVERGEEASALAALQAAEAVLRDLEARMRIWMGTTELAHFPLAYRHQRSVRSRGSVAAGGATDFGPRGLDQR